MAKNLPKTITSERYLQNLFELSKQLILSLDLDTILQTTVEGVAQISGLQTAAIYLLNEKTLRLWATTPPLPPDFPEALRLGMLDDYPYMRSSIESLESVLLEDVAEIQGSPAEMAVAKLRNLRTLLFLPLIAETEVLGALIVGSIGIPMSVKQIDRDLAFTFANFAALAVKNAKLYQTGQQYATQLEETLEERRKAEAEREKLREQLIQSQKMDAVGQLAGGMAHDFNNMLCGIIGTAELLHESTTDEELRDLAQQIVSIGNRSAELNDQLLAFSRKGQIQKIEVDLHAILEEIVSILRHTIDRKVTVETSFEAEVPLTSGDPAQIQSALLNLALNARDAMPGGGVLELRTECIDFDDQQRPECAFPMEPGRYVEVTVRDSGVGMSSEILERIYEPFYTTKKRGEGTGLGLAAVYGTMKAHDGSICVKSTPGKGTTFNLCFPQMMVTPGKTEQAVAHDSNVSIPAVANDRKPRILVIDDEAIVTTVVSRHLQNAGYEPIVFTDSIEGLAYFKDHHSLLSMVILDMVMPKMDGKELFYAIKAIQPDIPVVISSGFSVSGAIQKLLDDGARLFIPKPFQREDLIQAVEKVFAGS